MIRFERNADVRGFHPRGIKARSAAARSPDRPQGLAICEMLRTDQRFFGLGKDKVHLTTG